MSEETLLIHLHGFKCAGTTFAGILEKNFPNKVLYVESLIANQRLRFDQLKQLLDTKSINAISSHLLARQEISNHLIISFLRNPVKRLISAYEFQKATNTLKPGDDNFRAFLNRLRPSSVANYQTRLISIQSFKGSGQRQGWDIDPWSINLTSPNLFIGTVELFDESMVLLEAWLDGHGIKFDASYKSAMNRSNQTFDSKNEINPELIYPDMVEIDYILWEKVTNHLKLQMSTDSNFDQKCENFRMRNRAQMDDLVVVDPESFIRL